MGNEIVKFNDIEVKVKQKMKDAFLEMIPEEAWDDLARQFLGQNGERILRPMLEEVLKEIYKSELQRWVQARRTEIEDAIENKLGFTFAEACDNLGKHILDNLAAQTMNVVLNTIQNSTKTCPSCQVVVPYGSQYCPRCNNFVG